VETVKHSVTWSVRNFCDGQLEEQGMGTWVLFLTHFVSGERKVSFLTSVTSYVFICVLITFLLNVYVTLNTSVTGRISTLFSSTV